MTSPTRPTGQYLAILTLSALGIVYGDIGTSPLYAMRECFHGPHGIAPTRENVLGVLSLIFWSSWGGPGRRERVVDERPV